MIDHLLACLQPADYRRPEIRTALLRAALVETLGFSSDDATAYTHGVRLADLPDARALVDRRFSEIRRR